MIYLTSGTPGAGKTLLTIDDVDQRATKENRQVYYFGIAELTLDWKQLDDAREWSKVPDGAIVVIDEAWEHFPVRKQGSEVPEYAQLFATHRHRGLDVYLISQHPDQIDTFVRKMVGEYRYVDRPHGLDYAVRWRFRHVCDWKSSVERQGADSERISYPKERFGVYKSAEVHTVKKVIPRKVLYLVPALVLVIGCGVVAYRALMHKPEAAAAAAKKDAGKGAKTPADAMKPAVGTPTLAEQAAKRAEDQLAYARARFPRIGDAPESAPIYDKLAQPVTFPVVAGCVSYKVKGLPVCRCVTQQATPVVVTDSFCRAYVVHGAFDPYLIGRDAGRAAAGERPKESSEGDRLQQQAGREAAPHIAAVTATASAGGATPAKQR